MRSCRKPFEYAYVFVGGDVRICPWNGIVIGNLLEHTLEEIWKSEQVETIRESFMRGELLGCNEQICPLCIQKRDSLMFTNDELQNLYDTLPNLPQIISLAYDERCNHACPSCRQGIMHFDQEYEKVDYRCQQDGY